jgi:hypothetical protein
MTLNDLFMDIESGMTTETHALLVSRLWDAFSGLIDDCPHEFQSHSTQDSILALNRLLHPSMGD